MFNQLVARISELMLLKSGPQDLPTSPSLLQLAVGLFFASAMARLLLVGGFVPALAQSVLTIVLLLVYVRQLLTWRKTPERYIQTLTALFFSGAVIGTLLLFPLKSLQPLLQAIAENPELSPQQLQIPGLAMYAWAGLSIWGLIITAHIFRHALTVSLGMGVAIALLYEVLLIMVVGFLGSLF